MAVFIFDNHLHLRRDGKYLEAVKEFKRSGGTHLVLCQYPMPAMVIKENSYRGCYEETLRMAEEIRTTIRDICVFITVGPYPVDYLKLKEHFGREKAIVLMKKGMDEAAELCENNQVIAIGEIGRPHFPVDDQVIQYSNEII